MTADPKGRSSIAIRSITMDGLFIALVFVATMFINLRLPIAANGGLIHLGNVPLFLAAIIFGRRTGTLAGAFGMGLFDLLLSPAPLAWRCSIWYPAGLSGRPLPLWW